MDLSFFTGLVFGLLTQFAPLYLPYLLPFRPVPGQVRWSEAQYERLYKGYQKLGFWYAVALTVGLGAAWDFAFRILRSLAYPDPADTGILVTPREGLWILAALVAGYACAKPTSHRALQIILKHRYPDYLTYRSLKAGYDKRLFHSVFSAILAAAVAGYTCHLATTYTAFTQDEIVVHRTLRPTLVYRYRDIVEIRGARGRVTINGKTKKYRKGVYVIEFTDGYQWHMWQADAAHNPCRGYRVVVYAAARSGQEIAGPDLQARCR